MRRRWGRPPRRRGRWRTAQLAAEPRLDSAPQQPASTFGNATHLVGTDVQPGTYRAGVTGLGGCYWSRLAGLGGNLDDIIANGIVQEGSAVVTIEPTDRAFESTGCGRWQSASSTGRAASTFGNGTHLVGSDIRPGTYRAAATGLGGCYWSRLAGLRGDLNDILANNIVQEGSANRAIESLRCQSIDSLHGIDQQAGSCSRVSDLVQQASSRRELRSGPASGAHSSSSCFLRVSSRRVRISSLGSAGPLADLIVQTEVLNSTQRPVCPSLRGNRSRRIGSPTTDRESPQDGIRRRPSRREGGSQ